MAFEATTEGSDVKKRSDHPLDSEQAQERLKVLMRYRRQSRAAHAENRREMAVDEDYYDAIQFSDEQLQILAERDQDARVWNVVKNTCNWLIGTERKMRIDYKVLPRNQQQAESAKTKTKVMKFVSDDSRAEFCLSQAFSDSVKAGVGWIEEGVRDDESKEPLFVRNEDWRNMWFDHLGRATDCSDWRYVFREKWVDLDIAQAMFPERAADLEGLANGVNSLYPYNPEDTILSDPATEFDMEADFDGLLGGAYDGTRLRVKIIEMWYRIPTKVQVLKVSSEGRQIPHGAADGAIYRKSDPVHKYMADNRLVTLTDAIRMQVRCAMWAGTTFLQDEPSPFNHDRFPFVPMFCYRRKRDGMPYGVIRDIRGPQDSINNHMARIEFLMASQKVIMEKGAVDDPEKFYEEYSRPDCLAMVNDGAISNNRVKVVDGVTQINGHVQQVQEAQRFVQTISGVQEPLKGQAPSEMSGKAIGLLQNQGMTTSGIPFDNYYEAFQLAGEIRLSNIEQFYDQAKTLRITGSQNKDEFVDINRYDEKQGRIVNSITESKADFVVGKQDYRETVRQAMLISFGDTLNNMARFGGKPAEAAFQLLDMYVDMMDDLPGKDEMVARIRRMNGQEGPDEESTPEEKAEKEQRRQAAAAQQEKAAAVQEAMAELELQLKKAEVASKQADAQGKQAKALLDSITASATRIEAFVKSLEAAGMIKLAPDLVDSADTIIDESDAVGVDHMPGVDPAAAQAQPQPMMPRQAMQQNPPIGEEQEQGGM